MNSSFSHTLDNPIWYALQTGNREFSNGNSVAQYLKRDVGLFAGLKSNQETDLKKLFVLVPKGGVILFVPEKISIPEEWTVKLNREILQMVYEGNIFEEDRSGIIKMKDENIPAMLELTRLTNPGPFFTRTIDLGNYEGIFEGGKLIAMTGRRLQPDPYIE